MNAVQSNSKGMQPLLTLASVRRQEAQMLARVADGELMQRAARALAERAVKMLRAMPGSPPVLGLIGPGHNGADVLATLCLLRQAGYDATAFVAAGEGSSALWQHWSDSFRALGGDRLPGTVTGACAHHPATARGLLIDGLFGIGLNRPLEGPCAQLATMTMQESCTVLAADVPSGLCPDSGEVIGGVAQVAVRATETVTFIADKPGLYTGRAAQFVGRRHLASLGAVGLQGDGELVTAQWAGAQLSVRGDASHKGTYGTAVVVGGSRNMPGAALLAAHGARAVGAGKVATLSPDEPVFDPGSPQLMAWSLQPGQALTARLGSASAIALGCGLGQSTRAAQWVRESLLLGLPIVLDADALNLLADERSGPALRGLLRARATQNATVLTPHPLEAARLLHTDAVSVQADRIDAARRLAADTQATVVLKGAGTVICSPAGHWAIVDAGSAALATGGTGDVLTGVITGLLAQGQPVENAARLAVWLHGISAQHWQAGFRRGVGLDLMALVARIVHTINTAGRR